MNNNHIYILKEHECHPEEDYPKKVVGSKSGFAYAYSSFEFAKKAMDEEVLESKSLEEEYPEEFSMNSILFYEIIEKKIDTWEEVCWFYNNLGNFLEKIDDKEDFQGLENPKYDLDDIVEFISDQKLQIGKVSSVPLGQKEALAKGLKEINNFYLIDSLDRDQDKHSHVIEIFILKKIGTSVKNNKLFLID